MHKHFCLVCGSVVAEGEFDCEFDYDHDFAVCCRCSKGPFMWDFLDVKPEE
jgi:hypothetical protein